MMKEKNIEIWEERLIAYFHGELDEKECGEVENWLASDPAHGKIYRRVCCDYYYMRWNCQEKAINAGRAKKRVRQAWASHRKLWTRYAVAASVVVLLAVGSIWWMNRVPVETPKEKIPVVITDGVQPQALLLLADGSEIALGKEKEVLVMNEDDLTVVADSTGGIRYTATRREATNEDIRRNTLIVPRGCEYFISLSDGTKVWLGADSRFEYPVSFGSGERWVNLQGEAYFEVAKDSLRPFVVSSGDYRMQVYGTEFDLNTYDETRVRLVLVKGAVGFRANASADEVRLQPGQLGEANVLTGKNSVREVNVAHYTAWREGTVIFENESLASIMERLQRWYDVDVFFESEDLKNVRFFGNLRRYEGIEEFLTCLEKASKARFSMKGRTIVIGYK